MIKIVERHFIHFQCNGVTGWVEIDPDGNKWVKYGGARMAYECLRGGLKNVVHSVMSQHSLFSAWRG